MKQTTLYLYYTLALALALGLVGSCSGSGSEESETDATTIDDDTDTLTTDPNATSGDPTGDPTSGPISGDLDILFVIDNSGSMSDAQRRVAAGAGELINALESGGVNYRIAVTTTDYGNP
ncbi:MAG: VWA domain-containing protein, partial [Myxococcales bacterium]|nr:VWA domain-containing protein [Myxococcales bacterium]